LQDILELDMSALDWMLKSYPEVKEREDMRRIIGRYGLSGTQQVLWCLLPCISRKMLGSFLLIQSTICRGPIFETS